MEGCIGLRNGLDKTDEVKDLCSCQTSKPDCKTLGRSFYKIVKYHFTYDPITIFSSNEAAQKQWGGKCRNEMNLISIVFI